MEKNDYVEWDKVPSREIDEISDEISEKELEKRKKRHGEIDLKNNILIDLFIEKFDDLFRVEGEKLGKPVYIYDFATDWSDAPHLEISYDNYYQTDPGGYWDFFRRGANSGEIFDNREDAFRCYLAVYYGAGDLDKDGTGFTEEIDKIIEEQDL